MEEWKDIKGYEGFYQVSNEGRIKGLRMRKILLYYLERGYPKVKLQREGKRKTQKIHRLVAQAFIPNPENKPHINHKNGIKTDNRVENLEWVTNQENLVHAWRTGLFKRGDESPFAKINRNDVEIIRQLANIAKVKRIAILYNVSTDLIYSVLRRKGRFQYV